MICSVSFSREVTQFHEKFRGGLSHIRYLNEGYDPTISIVFEMIEGVNETEPHTHYR